MSAPAADIHFLVYFFLVLNMICATVLPLIFLFYMNLRRDAEITPSVIGAAFYLVAFLLMSLSQSLFYTGGKPSFLSESPELHGMIVSAVTSLVEIAVLALGILIISKKGDRDDAVTFGTGFAAVKTTVFVSLKSLADFTVASKAAAGELGSMATNEETLNNLVQKAEFMSENFGVGYLADTLETLVTSAVLISMSVMLFSVFTRGMYIHLITAAAVYLVYGMPSLLFSAEIISVPHFVNVIITALLGAALSLFVWKFHFSKLPDPLSEWNERRAAEKEKALKKAAKQKNPNPYEIKRRR